MKEIEKRLAEHSIKLPAGGTLREDVIVKHGVKIGWKEALEWVRERIAKNLKTVSYDDNIACVNKIEQDIDNELGNSNGNGYRPICRTCGAKDECREMTDKVQNET